VSEGGFTNVLEVAIDGLPLHPKVAPKLVEGWVDASLNVPAAFQLMFRDPNRRVFEQLGVRLGSSVVLRAYAAGQDGSTPLMTGEVTALEADFDGTGKFSVLRGHDPGHRLLRHRRVAAYTGMKASEIAAELAAADGLEVGTITATEMRYTTITQPNVTDWEFLTRLAQENDREISFSPEGRFQFIEAKPAAGAPGASVTPRQSDLVLGSGGNLLRLRTGYTSSAQVSEVEVRGWSVPTKQKVTGQSRATSNPHLEIGATPAAVTTAFGPATLTETDVPFDTAQQVSEAATALAADVSDSFAELEAVVRGDPILRPGLAVALNGVGEPFEGKYTITAVRHTFLVGSGYETWVAVTGRQHRSLFGLASGGAARSPRMPGVANALVTDIQDPEHHGRVKLTFPWLSDTYVSDWCRVAQFGGERGGALILPEVGDEVLVAFDRGALDHPYVIGGLYNGIDRLPAYEPLPVVDRTSGRVNWRAFADRAGNRVELLDALTTKGVKISSANDELTIRLDQTKTTITVDSAGQVTIRGGAAVSVEAGADLSLRAGGAVSISAGAAVNIAAGAEVAIEAGAEVDLTAGAAVTIDATADVTAVAVGDVNITGVNVELTGVVTANEMPVV
jgi:phage protein D